MHAINTVSLTLRKALVVLFPGKIWIGFLVLLLFFAMDATVMLAYLVGSYLWFIYALALSVVCHEAGHYVAARLVGERPWR